MRHLRASNPMRPARPHARRGSVIAIVIWALAIAAIVGSTLQIFAYRQATLGREVVGRTQARWAARAGVERSIAVMAYHNRYPVPFDGKAMLLDLENVSYDELLGATYDIRHHVDGQTWMGPLDEHSRFNVNAGNQGLLQLIPDVTDDVVDSMLDWIEQGDEPRLQGAKADWYLARGLNYVPRGIPFRSLAEIEMVAGVWPRYFRGEDWNLNNRLDPNENDGTLTWPPDQADDALNVGWAGYMTVYSRDGGPTVSGEPRIYLSEAETDLLIERLGIDEAQAQALISFGSNPEAQLSTLLTTPLNEAGSQQGGRGGRGGGNRGPQTNRNAGAGGGGGGDSDIAPLSMEQLRLVFAETSIEDPETVRPGKINMNTVSPYLLRSLLAGRESLADEIIYLRRSKPQGVGSVVDLLEIPNLTPEDLADLTSMLDVHSNVFTITSRGRSQGTGLEVEIIVVVDRSTLPVTIIEYREQ